MLYQYPRHAVLNNSMLQPFPDECETIYFAMGCFWGAERIFWQLPGIFITAVGYCGGETDDPDYDEVCSGLSGHAETVQVVYFPAQISFEHLLKSFWESHNPTLGMRQGNDVGSQYRSAIFYTNQHQQQIASHSMKSYQKKLSANGFSSITTEISPITKFWPAEIVHQQYLSYNPQGYCGLEGCGVICNN